MTVLMYTYTYKTAGSKQGADGTALLLTCIHCRDRLDKTNIIESVMVADPSFMVHAL